MSIRGGKTARICAGTIILRQLLVQFAAVLNCRLNSDKTESRNGRQN